jgi:hypothetical protein
VIAVIRGVIRAEDEAIDQYKKLIKMCDPIDLVTQDLILNHRAGTGAPPTIYRLPLRVRTRRSQATHRRSVALMCADASAP